MKRLIDVVISERLVVAVIILNTLAMLTMGYTDPDLSGARDFELAHSELIYAIAHRIDYACVVYFVIEMLAKIATGGFHKYWSDSWNRFDMAVVLLSAPLLLEPWIPLTGTLTVIVGLRLGRLFRLFRFLWFIPNRAHIYKGVKRALRASVGVFLALFIINVVLSIGATELFGRYAPEYFGNPALSSYSLFRVFTVEGWYEIPDLIAERAGPFVALMARLYFIFAVMVGGILGLSMANAVFVDEMTVDNNEDLETKLDTLLDEVRKLRAELEARDD